ncbi:MAG: crossover junction endodeoxyribonuclease RuvC [Candidatus Harrisonbacteria bacterium]|nr:crossover junction endodeoxyribonuclease RuvC [Candidatus Harrisonbacteria bacterium]
MIILGIDPGSIRIGYGLIKTNGGLSALDYGVIEIKRKNAAELILKAAEEISKLIKKYHPDMAGIEKIYFSKNVKTGIEVSQTRGAIILEIARQKIPIKELSPSEIKLAVTGYGLADKKAVAKMTARLLSLEKIEGFDDASDALAIAIAASATRTYLNNTLDEN